jgi:hypothetical protein
VEKLIEFL